MVLLLGMMVMDSCSSNRGLQAQARQQQQVPVLVLARMVAEGSVLKTLLARGNCGRSCSSIVSRPVGTGGHL